MTRPMSDQEFVHSRGNHCPVCRSTNVEAGDHENDGEYYSQLVRCLACHASWWEVYILSGYDDLDTSDVDPTILHAQEETTP